MPAWIFNLLFLGSLALEAMPAQVIIIRHAERYPFTGALAGQLNPEGLRRAGALSSFFTLSDPDTTNVPLLTQGPPDFLFAARPVQDGFFDNAIRCLQTISTTATTLRSPVHLGFTAGQEVELASLLLHSPKYDGKNILICWHSFNIPKLIRELGYICLYTRGEDYPETRFDLVWFLPMPAPTPPETVNPILQELLYNDATSYPAPP
jgi:hypothetical protein